MAETHEVTGTLIINHKAREWCQLPYPGHPRGCPNYGKKPDCPPQAPVIGDWLDLGKPHWFIVSPFDLSAHAQRMKDKHPEWSNKQCRCVLYWQNTPRKELRNAIKQFTEEHPGIISTLTPEAMGIHVIRTAKRLGIPIKAKPNETVYKIALVGYPKETHHFPSVGETCNHCGKGVMQLIRRPRLTYDLVRCDNDHCNYTYHSRNHKQKQYRLNGSYEYLDH